MGCRRGEKAVLGRGCWGEGVVLGGRGEEGAVLGRGCWEKWEGEGKKGLYLGGERGRRGCTWEGCWEEGEVLGREGGREKGPPQHTLPGKAAIPSLVQPSPHLSTYLSKPAHP